MNCNEARQHWNLYHDSEGDPSLHFEINEHLAVCPDCAQWFSEQSRLEHLLAEKLKAPPPTPELWDKVLSRAGLKRPARSRRLLLIAGVAASAAAAAAFLLWFQLFSGGNDLARLAADRHRRLAEKVEKPELESGSDLAVEGYLRERVNFPVRCPPRKDAGFEVQGAGTCKLGGQPAAYLSGRVGSAPVSVFILHRDSLEHFPRQLRAVRREKTFRGREGHYEMVLRVIDQNAVVVIGEADPRSLEQVLNAYASYPDHPRKPGRG
jgi:hypothetical protein